MREGVERVAGDVITIDPRLTLSELYARLDDQELLVEPLSSCKPIGNWLLEGGIGYNSLREGSLGSTVYSFKASCKGEPFRYGLKYSTLYSTGYPLHRIVEGSPSMLKDLHLGPIEELTLAVKRRERLTLSVGDAEISQLRPPPEATNALYLNALGAKLMGLKKEGFLVTYPEGYGEGEKMEEIWGKRFILDGLPDDHAILKVLTMKSNLTDVYEKSRKTKGLFLAIFTNKGVLVVVSGGEDELSDIWSSLAECRFTYRIS